MSEKLQQLTAKIYEEGIEKAVAESERILAKAREKALKITEKAQAERDQLIEMAQAEAEAYRKKVDAEIKLAARKTISRIKQDLTGLITERTVEVPVREALADQDKLAELIKSALGALTRNEKGNWQLLVPEDVEEAIRDHFRDAKQQALTTGIEISGKEGLKYGFHIRPEGENFTLVFDDRAFIDLFSPYLSIETAELVKNGD